MSQVSYLEILPHEINYIILDLVDISQLHDIYLSRIIQEDILCNNDYWIKRLSQEFPVLNLNFLKKKILNKSDNCFVIRYLLYKNIKFHYDKCLSDIKMVIKKSGDVCSIDVGVTRSYLEHYDIDILKLLSPDEYIFKELLSLFHIKGILVKYYMYKEKVSVEIGYFEEKKELISTYNICRVWVEVISKYVISVDTYINIIVYSGCKYD